MPAVLAAPVAPTAVAVAAALALAGCGAATFHTAAPSPRPAPTAVPSPTTTPAPTSATGAPAVPLRAPVTTVPQAPDPDAAGVPATIGPLRLLSATVVVGPLADQGLATRTLPGGGTAITYRGDADVTPAMQAAGWTHVGDPGAWGGWLVDAWQGRADAKLFRVTSPAGVVTDVVHPLAAGESANDSFAAVSPDGRWVVSGEWGDERRLLVLPAPWPTGTAPQGASTGPLATSVGLAGTISLGRPVRDVQGCDFVDATALICTTADPGRDLWPTPDQLLEVRLSAPLGPGRTSPAGTVSEVGPLLAATACGPAEPEGIDVDRAAGVVRVDAIGPGSCDLAAHLAAYRLAPLP